MHLSEVDRAGNIVGNEADAALSLEIEPHADPGFSDVVRHRDAGAQCELVGKAVDETTCQSCLAFVFDGDQGDAGRKHRGPDADAGMQSRSETLLRRPVRRPSQRPQPAGRQRVEPGDRRGVVGGDAGRRALAITGHAGALRAGATGQTGCGGEIMVQAGFARSPHSLTLSRVSLVRGAELGLALYLGV